MKKNGNNKMNKYSKKQFIIVCIFVVFAVSLLQILGRYVVNNIRNFYTESEEFYFYSDKLTEDNQVYQIDNWSGIENYTISIGMNSIENELLTASYNIDYEIEVTSSNNILCQLTKDGQAFANNTTRRILNDTNRDSFNVVITPNTVLKTGDVATVEIKATTNEPYQKTIRATFKLVVEHVHFSWEIIDSPSNPYLILSMTNTTPQATSITLSFNPNNVLLDMASSDYSKFSSTNYTPINSYNYISGVTFNLGALSSDTIKFYKVNKLADYTYPGLNVTPIINVQNI